MRDTSTDSGTLTQLRTRWCALERGWRATLFGLTLVTIVAVGTP